MRKKLSLKKYAQKNAQKSVRNKSMHKSVSAKRYAQKGKFKKVTSIKVEFKKECAKR